MRDRVWIAAFVVSCVSASPVGADDSPPTPSVRLPDEWRSFLDAHCVGCHDGEAEKGGLDLEAMAFEPRDARNFSSWVEVFERVDAGEMPPKKGERPAPAQFEAFSRSLTPALATSERERVARDGRAARRRLNRHEYENNLRDLLDAPRLEVKEILPEDGVAHRFDKVSEALDFSHIQITRYLVAADYALRQTTAAQVDRHATKTVRYYACDQTSFTGKLKFGVLNASPERATRPPQKTPPATRRALATLWKRSG